MVIPSCLFGYLALAHDTQAPLGHIQLDPLLAVGHVFRHAYLSQFLTIHFLRWVKGMVVPSNLLVPSDLRTRKRVQLQPEGGALLIHSCGSKHPVPSLDGSEILPPHPLSILPSMSPFCPPPQSPENLVLHLGERRLCYH